MMTGRGGGQPAADGGLARHIPVLGGPAVEFLNVRDGGVYIDATFGAGGYTAAILAAANCNVIGIDRDQRAIAGGFDLVSDAAGRLVLVEDRFSNLEHVARSLGHETVDGIHFDYDMAIADNFVDSRGTWLTANDTTIYAVTNLDLGKFGPMVVEIPPGAIVGLIVDFWQRASRTTRLERGHVN